MNNAGEVEMLDATEHLVKKVRHPLVVQVHVDHLPFYIWSMFAEILKTWQRFASISSITM